jgi:hypothetical protein
MSAAIGLGLNRQLEADLKFILTDRNPAVTGGVSVIINPGLG